MNPNKEAEKQRFDRLKKQALLALTTAFRVPLMFVMGCAILDKESMGLNGIMHDHDGLQIAKFSYEEDEIYDPAKHGGFKEYFNEGDVLYESHGKKAVHRHPKNGEVLSTSGGIEYKFE